jgi:hypothetical protein
MRCMGVFSLVAVACAGTGTLAPGLKGPPIASPTRDAQSPPRLAASHKEIATAVGNVTSEMTPDDVERLCRERGGRAGRYLTSNRISINCELSGAVFSDFWVGYCPLPENKRVCFLTQHSAPMAADRAEHLRTKVAGQLTSAHGPNVEKGGNTWSWSWGADGKIDLSTDAEPAGTRVSLFHGTAEGIKNMLDLPPEFPSEVVGFRFGATEQEARAACERNGGEFVSAGVLRAAGAQTIAPAVGCNHPRVELPFEVTNAYAMFCDDRICEVGLILGSPLAAALAAMSDKYGAPRSCTEPDDCNSAAARHLWTWGAVGVVTGTVKLSDNCGPAIYYDNALGYQLRDQERARRKQNF